MDKKHIYCKDNWIEFFEIKESKYLEHNKLSTISNYLLINLSDETDEFVRLESNNWINDKINEIHNEMNRIEKLRLLSEPYITFFIKIILN